MKNINHASVQHMIEISQVELSLVDGGCGNDYSGYSCTRCVSWIIAPLAFVVGIILLFSIKKELSCDSNECSCLQPNPSADLNCTSQDYKCECVYFPI